MSEKETQYRRYAFGYTSPGNELSVQAANKARLEALRRSMPKSEFDVKEAWLEYLYPGHHWLTCYVAEMERQVFVTFRSDGRGEWDCAVVTIEGTPPAGEFRVDLHTDKQLVHLAMPYYGRTGRIREGSRVRGQRLRRALYALVHECMPSQACLDEPANKPGERLTHKDYPEVCTYVTVTPTPGEAPRGASPEPPQTRDMRDGDRGGMGQLGDVQSQHKEAE